MGDLKERLASELGESGTISSADVAEYQSTQDREERAERKEEAEGPTTVPVVKEADLDPVRQAADEYSPENEIQDALAMDPILTPREVTLTPEDKALFLDSVVNNNRFELPFNLFGGKVVGVFRSRKHNETRAVLNEIHRSMQVKEMTDPSNSMMEYSIVMRKSLLRFQLAEMNGAEYPLPKEPITSQVKMAVATEDGAPAVTPPAWVDEADKQFGSMEDAMLTALWQALSEFEDKYWTMTRNAGDQNFWKTEDSTSA